MSFFFKLINEHELLFLSGRKLVNKIEANQCCTDNRSIRW